MNHAPSSRTAARPVVITSIAVLLAGGASLAACSDGTTPSSTASDAGGDATAASDAGDGGALPVSCANYCAIIKASCTGANLQYKDDGHCANACKVFEQGTAGATSGNTIACRQYHATAAASQGAALHCPHAGPSGGGMCGSRCEALCTFATNGPCAADAGVANPPYADLAACTAACAAGGPAFSLNPDAGEMYGATIDGDNIQCRIYHLITAHSNPPTSANDHCAHGNADGGGVCK